MPRIASGRLLTEEEARQVKAALTLAGHTQKSYAASLEVSYDRLNRMVARVESVTPAYAKLFNQLVGRQLAGAARLAA